MAKSVTVRLGSRSYDILVGDGVLKKALNPLKRLSIGCDVAVVTDRRIQTLFGRELERVLLSKLRSRLWLVAPEGEKAKSLPAAADLIAKLSGWDVRRQTFLIALGGGAIGDLTGFIASIYKRSIPYVQIPTTLLAQVDSSIGGKVAVDLPKGKNLLGSFYQPRLVVCELSFLKKLPERELRSGLGEIIKYAAIFDRDFFSWLDEKRDSILAREMKPLEEVVFRCAQWKARIVEEDERETKGLRTLLNFGHTIGHALETAAGYQRTWTHGEAISVGMCAAARLSASLGLLKEDKAGRLRDLLEAYGLPTAFPRTHRARVLRSMAHDKKFVRGTNRLVLLKDLGHAAVVDKIPTAAIARALS